MSMSALRLDLAWRAEFFFHLRCGFSSVRYEMHILFLCVWKDSGQSETKRGGCAHRSHTYICSHHRFYRDLSLDTRTSTYLPSSPSPFECFSSNPGPVHLVRDIFGWPSLSSCRPSQLEGDVAADGVADELPEHEVMHLSERLGRFMPLSSLDSTLCRSTTYLRRSRTYVSP